MAESVTAEVKENSSLRARTKARVDKPEEPSAEKQKKSKNSENAATDDEQLGRLQPACLGIGVAVILASIILYLATPPGPMKPVCIGDSLPLENLQPAYYNAVNDVSRCQLSWKIFGFCA